MFLYVLPKLTTMHNKNKGSLCGWCAARVAHQENMRNTLSTQVCLSVLFCCTLLFSLLHWLWGWAGPHVYIALHSEDSQHFSLQHWLQQVSGKKLRRLSAHHTNTALYLVLLQISNFQVSSQSYKISLLKYKTLPGTW